MVNQKALSLKLDLSVFDSLEKESSCSAVSKNRIINNAVEFYIEVLDHVRHEGSCVLCDHVVEKLLNKLYYADRS